MSGSQLSATAIEKQLHIPTQRPIKQHLLDFTRDTREVSSKFSVKGSLMFIVDVALKNNPVPISVQRKSEDDAKALYQQISEAMRSGNPASIELTCEQQAGKTVCILASEIAAVQMAEKSGSATSSGRPPGFFALAE